MAMLGAAAGNTMAQPVSVPVFGPTKRVAIYDVVKPGSLESYSSTSATVGAKPIVKSTISEKYFLVLLLHSNIFLAEPPGAPYYLVRFYTDPTVLINKKPAKYYSVDGPKNYRFLTISGSEVSTWDKGRFSQPLDPSSPTAEFATLHELRGPSLTVGDVIYKWGFSQVSFLNVPSTGFPLTHSSELSSLYGDLPL